MEKGEFDGGYPKLISCVRLLGFLLMFVYLLASFAFAPALTMIFLTSWGAMFTFIIFFLILVNSCSPLARKIAVNTLPSIWILNGLIMLGFWCLVFPVLSDKSIIFFYCIPHGPPFILTSVELFYNQVIIKRLHMIVSYIVLMFYTVAVNLPYTLADEAVYPDMDYVTYYSYLTLAVMTIVNFAIGEIGFRIKRRVLKNRGAAENPLTDSLEIMNNE